MGLSAAATAQDLAHTIRKRLAERPHFSAPRRPPTGFEIDHYAGRCEHSLSMPDDCVQLLPCEHVQLSVR